MMRENNSQTSLEYKLLIQHFCGLSCKEGGKYAILFVSLFLPWNYRELSNYKNNSKVGIFPYIVTFSIYNYRSIWEQLVLVWFT